MENIQKKLSHNFKYAIYLCIDLISIGGWSFLLYVVATGNLFVVYISNVLFIVGVLVEEELWSKLFEKWYYKLKKDGFIKRRLKEWLVSMGHKPSVKVALSTYYLICIAAERFIYFGVGENIVGITYFKEYLSIMYYSFILFMALDKVKGVMSKENSVRKKRYAKFKEEQETNTFPQ